MFFLINITFINFYFRKWSLVTFPRSGLNKARYMILHTIKVILLYFLLRNVFYYNTEDS